MKLRAAKRTPLCEARRKRTASNDGASMPFSCVLKTVGESSYLTFDATHPLNRHGVHFKKMTHPDGQRVKTHRVSFVCLRCHNGTWR